MWCNAEAIKCVRDKAVRGNTDLFGWKMYIKANMENREDFLTVVALNHISHKMQQEVRTLLSCTVDINPILLFSTALYTLSTHVLMQDSTL